MQAEVEQALRKLGWEGDSILGAGRTDAGVHAAGQVIAFDLAWEHSLDALVRAINANLAQDVAIQDIQPAPDGFHPRYDALERTYRYRIICNPLRQPLQEATAWRVWPLAAPADLNAAAAMLVGTHDFAAFGSPHKTGGSTIRRITRAEWLPAEEGQLHFWVSGNAFLYHMVRRMTAVCVAVGQGKLSLEDVASLLDGISPPSMELAPAHGLCLEAVRYAPGLAPRPQDPESIEAD